MKESYSYKAVFYAACTALVFFGVVLLSLGTVLPDVSSKFGLDDLASSSIVLFLPVGVLTGSLVFGPFVDRFGYKLLLAGSSFIVISGLVLLGLASDTFVLRIAVFMTGFGGGILNGEAITLVSDISPDDKKDVNQSFLSVFFGLGALIVPLVMRSLRNIYSYETILAGIAAFILLPSITFLFISFPPPKQPHGFPFRQGIDLLKQPVLLLFSFVLFFQSGIEGITSNWTTTYFEKSLLAPTNIALLALTLMVAGMTAGRFVAGFVVSKVTTCKIIVAASIIMITGIMAIIFLPSARLPAMFLLGLGFAPVFPVILGSIGKLYLALSGTAFSIALFISLLGNTVLNFIMGLLAKEYSMKMLPFLLLISVILMIFFSLTAIKKSGLKK
ncbi:MAG TPA: MFS transporter [Bacteroidales bacterium]|nr:MFS transporter [Bacteroidales bacterium]